MSGVQRKRNGYCYDNDNGNDYDNDNDYDYDNDNGYDNDPGCGIGIIVDRFGQGVRLGAWVLRWCFA